MEWVEWIFKRMENIIIFHHRTFHKFFNFLLLLSYISTFHIHSLFVTFSKSYVIFIFNLLCFVMLCYNLPDLCTSGVGKWASQLVSVLGVDFHWIYIENRENCVYFVIKIGKFHSFPFPGLKELFQFTILNRKLIEFWL